jgi:hypothetical protein
MIDRVPTWLLIAFTGLSSVAYVAIGGYVETH